MFPPLQQFWPTLNLLFNVNITVKCANTFSSSKHLRLAILDRYNKATNVPPMSDTYDVTGIPKHASVCDIHRKRSATKECVKHN